MKSQYLLFVFSLGVFDTAIADKLDQLYSQLTWGEHTVGFRYENVRDYNRTFSRLRNTSGELSASQVARPLQIGIWYPASVGDNVERLSFLDYVVLDEIAGKSESPEERDYEEAKSKYLNADLWTGQRDSEVLKENLSLELRAHLNAPPVAEFRFPLVVFAGHEFFGLSSNAILHEFIASHGYVVVSFKNKTIYPGAQNFKQHVNATAHDVRFVKRFAEGLDNADPEKMAIAGNSLGALSIFDVALDIWSPYKGRDYPFKGMVSINGEIGSKYNPDYIGTSLPRLKIGTIADFNIPLLHFRCKGNYWCNMQFKKVEHMFSQLGDVDATLISPRDLTGKDELSGMAFTSYYLITDLSSYMRFRQKRPHDVARLENQVSGFANMAHIYLRYLNLWLYGANDQRE